MRNQSPINRLSRRLTNEVLRYCPVFNEVNNRSQMPRVSKPRATLDIAFCKVAVMKYEHAGIWLLCRKLGGNDHMEFGAASAAVDGEMVLRDQLGKRG
jgi:hypothetical protein